MRPLQSTNNLGQRFQIQLLWTWSQLVSGGGVCLAHTYQLGLFPKQYRTMLPRGLQQNKTLISLNVIVISYSSKKKKEKKEGKAVAGARDRRATTAGCFAGLLHVHVDGQTRGDGCGRRPERTGSRSAALFYRTWWPRPRVASLTAHIWSLIVFHLRRTSELRWRPWRRIAACGLGVG